MMDNANRKQNISGLLVLLVFAVFMVSVMLVLLTGADIVRGLSQRDQEGYDRRTAVQYVSTRVRQGDRQGMISVAPFGDGDALVLLQEIDDVLFETKVYCYDGYLRELFTEADSGIEPEFGEQLLPMTALHMTREGSCLRCELEFDGQASETLVLYLRSGKEAEA